MPDDFIMAKLTLMFLLAGAQSTVLPMGIVLEKLGTTYPRQLEEVAQDLAMVPLPIVCRGRVVEGVLYISCEPYVRREPSEEHLSLVRFLGNRAVRVHWPGPSVVVSSEVFARWKFNYFAGPGSMAFKLPDAASGDTSYTEAYFGDRSW